MSEEDETTWRKRSPIKMYMEKSCLRCEEEGKCDYKKMELCIAIRLFELKERQIYEMTKQNLLSGENVKQRHLGPDER